MIHSHNCVSVKLARSWWFRCQFIAISLSYCGIRCTGGQCLDWNVCGFQQRIFEKIPEDLEDCSLFISFFSSFFVYSKYLVEKIAFYGHFTYIWCSCACRSQQDGMMTTANHYNDLFFTPCMHSDTTYNIIFYHLFNNIMIHAYFINWVSSPI